MPPLVAMKERAASRSPANFGIALDGGRATVPLRVDDETQLEDAILSIIGKVQPAGDGRLQRLCPLRHGRFPGYYGERVNGAEGVGKGLFHNTRLAVNENSNSLDDFALYDIYTLSADFLPRPYNILKDSEITFDPVTWHDSVSTTRTDVQTTEYKRFVEWDVVDDDTWLEADQGEMHVATSDAAIAPPSGLHGAAFVGKPRLYINQSKLFATWYCLPLYYLTHPNSWLRKLKNTVNQVSFLGYAAGKLLYRGATAVKKWTPFLAGPEPDNSPYVGGLAKVGDIRLEWGLRDQVVIAGGPTDDAYRLFRAPWNCAPSFLDTRWYSVILSDVSAPNDKTKWATIYGSSIHQLLFTDPAL
jgi:hypothetical protein